MSTYHANVERGDRFWLIHVPEVDRWTQARNLREVETMARDLVATMRDVEPDSFELEVEVTMPGSVEKHLVAAREFRARALEANAASAVESRTAACELAGQGIPLRDVGQLLGVSHQRAHQLVNG